MTDKDKFYKVYSPEKFKLRRRGDLYVDLKFDIQTLETIEAWLNLLSSLKQLGQHIKTKQNKRQYNSIAHTQ